MTQDFYSEILFQEPTILPEDFVLDDPVEIASNSTSDTQVNSIIDVIETPKLLDESVIHEPTEESVTLSVIDQNEQLEDWQEGPKLSSQPTIFEQFTKKQIDWCRYCGVTQRAQSAAFRPGPWGKRTLCNKHGCDYKGYGYIEKLPRLNLSQYEQESFDERKRPILQDWCAKCYEPHVDMTNILVQCDGCCRAYHQNCHPDLSILPSFLLGYNQRWYCGPLCAQNASQGLVVIEVPKKNLPLMRCTSKTIKKKKRSGSDTESLTVKKPKLPSEEISLAEITRSD